MLYLFLLLDGYLRTFWIRRSRFGYREPEADDAVELDAQLTKDWMNNITMSLVSLQASFSLLTKQKKSKKSKRPSDFAISSAEER